MKHQVEAHSGVVGTDLEEIFGTEYQDDEGKD